MEMEDFLGRIDRRSEFWVWTGAKNHDGYGVLMVEGHQKRAHRIAWQIEKGEIPKGLQVCHHCDNPPCCRVSHLFLGTNQDNIDDAIRKGRHKGRDNVILNSLRGEQNLLAKLTDEKVVLIRAMRKAGATYPQLVAQFNVAHSTLVYAVQRKTWAHVP